jgi:ABC-type lipoprotein release transport system permease subunit
MDRKKLIFIFLAIGSYVGSIIPSFWGAGMFSFSSVILSAVGGLAGIWLGFKLGS